MGSKWMKAWLKRIGIETKQNNIQNIKHAWAEKNKGPTSSKIVGDILTMSQTQIFKAEQRGDPQGKVNVCYFMRVQRQKTLKVGGRRDKGWVMLKTHRWPGVLFFFSISVHWDPPFKSGLLSKASRSNRKVKISASWQQSSAFEAISLATTQCRPQQLSKTAINMKEWPATPEAGEGDIKSE